MARSRRALDPDTKLEISLDATARRHGHDLTPTREAVDALRVLATGRTDLLAKAAGSILGGYLGSPATSHPMTVHAAGLRILAGADPDLTIAKAEETRAAVEAPRYSTNV